MLVVLDQLLLGWPDALRDEITAGKNFPTAPIR